MSVYALGFTLVFIAITIVVSMWQNLGLEREITIGTIRSSLQLLLVGYVLHYVFHTNNPILLICIIGIMIAVASWNTSQRGKGLAGIRWRIALSITVTEILIVILLICLPLSGMSIGNAMVVSSLYLNHMQRDVQSSRGEIEALLALGANERQSIQDCMKRAVKASMIPTIDGMKTVGLVQLPGMMTGMIIAGADPIEAVRYQILIMFAFTSSAGITSILLSLLSYKLWFTKRMNLRQY